MRNRFISRTSAAALMALAFDLTDGCPRPGPRRRRPRRSPPSAACRMDIRICRAPTTWPP